MARVNDQQGAKLLNLTLPTFKRLRRDFGPEGREPHFPNADANGLHDVAELQHWRAERQAARFITGRVDTTGAASILGVSEPTIGRYARSPTFVQTGEDGKYSVAELLHWHRSRPGRGAAGSSKGRTPQPCECCRELVLRRIVDEIDGKRKCRPCYVTPSRMAQDTNR